MRFIWKTAIIFLTYWFYTIAYRTTTGVNLYQLINPSFSQRFLPPIMQYSSFTFVQTFWISLTWGLFAYVLFIHVTEYKELYLGFLGIGLALIITSMLNISSDTSMIISLLAGVITWLASRRRFLKKNSANTYVSNSSISDSLTEEEWDTYDPSL